MLCTKYQVVDMKPGGINWAKIWKNNLNHNETVDLNWRFYLAYPDTVKWSKKS